MECGKLLFGRDFTVKKINSQNIFNVYSNIFRFIKYELENILAGLLLVKIVSIHSRLGEYIYMYYI